MFGSSARVDTASQRLDRQRMQQIEEECVLPPISVLVSNRAAETPSRGCHAEPVGEFREEGRPVLLHEAKRRRCAKSTFEAAL